MSSRLSSFATSLLGLIIPLLVASCPAAAFDPVGGPGGGSFKAPCPTDKFLIGVNAKTGAVVDQISIVCGSVSDNGAVVSEPPTTTHPTYGGAGGSPTIKSTCANDEVIHGLGIVPGQMPPHTVVRLIIFDCVATRSSARHNLDIGSAPFFPNAENSQPCPAGQAATGIHGRSGSYLDAVAIDCGPLPAALTTGPGTGPVNPPTADPCAAAPNADDKSMCEEHNTRRALHGVPALTWDANLTNNAQLWVNQCRTQKDANGNDFFCHQNDCGPGDPFGENLSYYYGSPAQTPADVVEGWYCEINVYDFNNPVFVGGGLNGCTPTGNPNKVDGHFTQVVWKDTKRLGCAKNVCPLGGNSATLWACEYDPPGNFNVDQPGVLQNEVPRKVQGFVAGPAPIGIGAPSVSPQKTTAIISDVDLYDVPGGTGRVIGMLKQGQQFPLIQCRIDDWCQLPVGWVWGSFIMRNHTMGTANSAETLSKR